MRTLNKNHNRMMLGTSRVNENFEIYTIALNRKYFLNLFQYKITITCVSRYFSYLYYVFIASLNQIEIICEELYILTITT